MATTPTTFLWPEQDQSSLHPLLRYILILSFCVRLVFQVSSFIPTEMSDTVKEDEMICCDFEWWRWWHPQQRQWWWW
jgi:hypothetical protein